MGFARSSRVLLVALGCAACGPGSVASEAGDRVDGSDTDSGGSGSEGQDELGTDTAPTSADTDEGCSFACETDTGLGELCDIVVQDCPEGEKCVPDPQGQDEPRCVMVAGDKPFGESCTYDPDTREDDCGIDGFCWSLSGEDPRCAPFCTVEVGCEWGESCVEQLWPEGPALNLCAPSCDPLLGDCPEGAACYLSAPPEGWACLPVVGAAALGEPCEFQQDCAPDLHCIEAEALPSCAGDKCCASYCDVGDPGSACDATPGSVCVVWIADPWCENFLGLCLDPDWPGAC